MHLMTTVHAAGDRCWLDSNCPCSAGNGWISRRHSRPQFPRKSGSPIARRRIQEVLSGCARTGGRDYTGVDSEYAAHLSRAAQELTHAGATEIATLSFFLSEADPLHKRIKPLVPAYTGGLPVRWAQET